MAGARRSRSRESRRVRQSISVSVNSVVVWYIQSAKEIIYKIDIAVAVAVRVTFTVGLIRIVTVGANYCIIVDDQQLPNRNYYRRLYYALRLHIWHHKVKWMLRWQRPTESRLQLHSVNGHAKSAFNLNAKGSKQKFLIGWMAFSTGIQIDSNAFTIPLTSTQPWVDNFYGFLSVGFSQLCWRWWTLNTKPDLK